MSRLPALPGSDPETLGKNIPDSFYKKKPRDIWSGEINISKKDSNRCAHYFEMTETGAECKKCRWGLLGKELTAKNGDLYAKNEKVLWN